jgi:hypothetical protein
MPWIIRWLICREYRIRRDWILSERRTDYRERRLLHMILGYKPGDVYFHCHCGRYSDSSRLCPEHKVG